MNKRANKKMPYIVDAIAVEHLNMTCFCCHKNKAVRRLTVKVSTILSICTCVCSECKNKGMEWITRTQGIGDRAGKGVIIDD